jgi:hypothetical protein
MRALTVEELGWVSGGSYKGAWSRGGGVPFRTLGETETVVVTASRNGGGDDPGADSDFGECFSSNMGDDIVSSDTILAALGGAVSMGAYGATWGAAAGLPGMAVGMVGGVLAGVAFGATGNILRAGLVNSLDCAFGM